MEIRKMSRKKMVKMTTDQIARLKNLFPKIEKGRAENTDAKIEMVALHNDIFGSNYNPRTNCAKCLDTCFKGIKKLYYDTE